MLRRRILRRKTGGFVGAYDVFAASLAHVYEPARRTLTAYVGDLCRLRRASDDAELDWGYLANGDLNVAGIAAWAGGASYVVSIYDQVAGDTITQAVKANQSLFVAAAQNGHAGMTLDVTDYLQGAYTTGGALSQPFNLFVIAQLNAALINDGGQYNLTDGDDAVNTMFIYKNPAPVPDGWALYAGGVLAGEDASVGYKLFSAVFNGATSLLKVNAGADAPGNAGAHNADGITIGASSAGALGWVGQWTSAIICDPALSAGNRTAMETAINSYWAAY